MRSSRWYIKKGKALDEAQGAWETIRFGLRMARDVAIGLIVGASVFGGVATGPALMLGGAVLVLHSVARHIAENHFVHKKLDEIEQKFAEEEESNGE